MNKAVIVLGILAVISSYLSYPACLPPSPGTPVWKIAADNIRTTNTIESKVCNLIVTDDFSGTFTVLDTVLSKVCAVASKAEQLATQIDVTELNFNLDLSKVCAIEDNLNLIHLNLESFDIIGTFTTLEGLKQTVCSKIELINQQLSGIQAEITDLTATEIDHAATIASQLEVLDIEVISINSILDTLSFDLKLNTACSLLDIIDGCLQTVESKVNLLDNTIQIGFSGTFTALDINLAKACTIESLVDIIPMSFMADLSETFSALNALQEKMCTIDSKVDDLDMSIMSVESGVDILDSKLDPIISKLCIIESKADAAESRPLFSLFDNAIQVLDQDCSILEELNNNQMLEKSCTIESNLDAITTQLLTQESKLEIIDSSLEIIASKICTFATDNIAISKLCVIDSKIDVEQNTALTIESIIDSFDDTISRFDVIDGLSETILSKLCVTELATQPICSKLEEFALTVSTIESKLDLLLSTSPGSLCSNFGSNGTVTTSFGAGTNNQANAGVLQSDGKVIAIGLDNTSGSNDFALARYNSDGSLDSSFGTGGLVTTDFGGGTNDVGHGGVLQPDGKIVAVGQANIGGNKFALARYNTDGSLDSSFGTGGLVTTDFGAGGEFAFAALQKDGKIVAVGRAGASGAFDFALARYNTDGSLDSSFGIGGLVTTNLGGTNDEGRAALIQPNGKIVAVGIAGASGAFDFALARYNTDGSLDDSFGIGGIVTTDFGGTDDRGFAAVLQPNGKIVAVGRTNSAPGNNFALARYNANGSLDASFGTGGLVVTDFGNNSFGAAAVLQPDDKIVAVGRSNEGGIGDNFALARYNTNGSLDDSFGAGGLVITDFGGSLDQGRAALLRRDGSLIVLGTANPTGQTFALACYETGLQSIWFVKQEVELLCNQIEAVSTSTLISKLCLIEEQVCAVESSLDALESFASVLSIQAQELIGDFQETWTMLEVIENKLCTSESVLDNVSNKLQVTLDDFSNVFTTIEAVDQKEIIVDGKVNTTENLVDGFTGFDFSGIFTVLEVIQSKVCLADDLVQTISAGLEDISDCLGIPIYQSDVDTTGLTINVAARYYLAEPIVYNPTATGTNVITIASNNVTLDLNGFSITQVSGQSGTSTTSGIVTNSGLSNIRIENGSVHDLTSKGVSFNSNCSDILLSNLAVSNVGTTIGSGFSGDNAIDFDTNCSNITAKHCTINGSVDASIAFFGTSNISVKNIVAIDAGEVACLVSSTTNIVIQNSTFLNGDSNFQFTAGSSNFFMSSCMLKQVMPNANQSVLITDGSLGGIIKNCIITEALSAEGIALILNTSEHVVIGNTITKCTGGAGINLRGSTENNTVIRNTLIENASNIDEASSTGANTYLGNFAFNSTAVGDPDNTNYSIAGGSDITRKFVTVGQTTSFSDRPTQWHNINMLP